VIRLPSSHAAITAPLVASDTEFPGIPIGRSTLDGRPFHLSPVMADASILPSTNSLALGGLGSGKSTTAKTRIRREIRDNQHQAVVIDSYGEDGVSGEWTPLTHDLGGKVIQAGSFTLNPCSELFPPAVREELIRSLILAVEPDALTTQAGHALQHALAHPKATALEPLVDALVSPQEGRWPVARLAEWGEGVAIALSRYTEGSLSGIFDGAGSTLPETDLPIISFDFTLLDRNSPAIPSLMAAVSCWAEHVWLRQSTAVHRHLVLEEAWQILLSPATAALIQRQLKNSRKAALSLDVVMHTLSDLGDGRAQDLARLCEIAHIGRLNPEEADIVGSLLGLPEWAVDMIPMLDPGQAVWKVGPDYVDVIETVLDEDERRLTDTSARRRKAQEQVADHAADHAAEQALLAEDLEEGFDAIDGTGVELEKIEELEKTGLESSEAATASSEDGDWDWEMPPNMIDTRHQDVLQAAREGRCTEAADLAVIGEREDIRAYGINSDEAAGWLVTRAQVAELCGDRNQAAQLRATVARMGKDAQWYEQPHNPDQQTDDSTVHGVPRQLPPPPAHGSRAPISGSGRDEPPPSKRRRAWRYVAAIAVVGVAVGAYLQQGSLDQEREKRTATAAAYKGRSGAALRIDGVKVDVIARWSNDRKRVVLELSSYFDRNAKYLRLDAGEQTASSTQEDGYYPRDPQLALPVDDPLAEVTVRVTVGGASWKEGVRAPSQEVRLSPAGTAHDAKTGQQLPSDL